MALKLERFIIICKEASMSGQFALLFTEKSTGNQVETDEWSQVCRRHRSEKRYWRRYWTHSSVTNNLLIEDNSNFIKEMVNFLTMLFSKWQMSYTSIWKFSLDFFVIGRIPKAVCRELTTLSVTINLGLIVVLCSSRRLLFAAAADARENLLLDDINTTKMKCVPFSPLSWQPFVTTTICYSLFQCWRTIKEERTGRHKSIKCEREADTFRALNSSLSSKQRLRVIISQKLR